MSAIHFFSMMRVRHGLVCGSLPSARTGACRTGHPAGWILSRSALAMIDEIVFNALTDLQPDSYTIPLFHKVFARSFKLRYNVLWIFPIRHKSN
ncbi:hypothetical protein [Chloroflexus sp.]|uniref:hypothetical protein n=1 Tax=Chloroflexus sp. TaxID=1904827 RepID=UPI004049FE51